MTPDQFWRLSPIELHWFIEAKQPEPTYGVGKGAMTQAEVEDLYELNFGPGGLREFK